MLIAQNLYSFMRAAKRKPPFIFSLGCERFLSFLLPWKVLTDTNVRTLLSQHNILSTRRTKRYYVYRLQDAYRNYTFRLEDRQCKAYTSESYVLIQSSSAFFIKMITLRLVGHRLASVQHFNTTTTTNEQFMYKTSFGQNELLSKLNLIKFSLSWF